MFLEEYKTLPATLREQLDWKCPDKMKHVKHGSSGMLPAADLMAKDRQTYDLLWEATAFDRELYRFAKERETRKPRAPVSSMKTSDETDDPPAFKAAMVFAALQRGAPEKAKPFLDMPANATAESCMAAYAYNISSERTNLAKAALDHPIVRDAKDPGVHLWRGQQWEKDGSLDTAQSAYRKAVEAAPGHVESRLALAELLLRQKRPAAAQSELSHALAQKKKGSLDAFYIRGEMVRLALTYKRPGLALRYVIAFLGDIRRYPALRRRFAQKLFPG